MSPRLLSLSLLVALMPVGASVAQAPATVSTFSMFDPQSAAKAATREDVLYQQGTQALDNENYDEAVNKFGQVAAMRGRKADGALYWKAYALNKAGNKVQAQATITQLRKAYPQSKWLKEAGALEIEMKGAAANPANISDEELKLLAIRSLMNSEPDKAVPLLDKIIHGNYSPRLKDRALFVLSQNSSEKAQQILLSLARTNTDPDLQKRAIRYIGMGGKRNRGVLKEIYNNATDASVKKAVFRGWLMAGDKDDVLAVARTEKSAELRREAIRYLGMMGGRTELREMYKNSSDPGTREAVIRGLMMSGDSQGLAQIAATEKDPKVLHKAIRTLGIVGGAESLTALTNIYSSHTDLETRKSVITAMFLHGAAKEMIAMARKETNPELKKAWVQKLSLMNSPEVTRYMMEILNK